VDDEPIERVMRLYGLKTRHEAIDFALRRLVPDGGPGRPPLPCGGRVGAAPRRDERSSGRRAVMVVDTSAWVETRRCTESPVNVTLSRLLAEKAELAVTEAVVMEVLAGARSPDEERRLRSTLLGFPVHPVTD
jgi:hypothetical protein